MCCKGCWPQTIPAASLSCANCTAGKFFFYDQSNVPDTNFWTLSGDAAASKGTPPLYAVSANTVSTSLTSTFTQSALLYMNSVQANFRASMNVRGTVSGTFLQSRLQWGTGVNGHISVELTWLTVSSVFTRRLRVLNNAGGVLFTQDISVGTSPIVGAAYTGTVLIVNRGTNPGYIFDVYFSGTKVVTGYTPSGTGTTKIILTPKWTDNNDYAGGVNANAGNFENRWGNVYITANSGLPYSCCG